MKALPKDVSKKKEETKGSPLEVADLAEKGACGDDGEARTETPDDTNENGDNFVAKKLIQSVNERKDR